MAIQFIDRCRFTPTAGSTTDWTYSSAVTGYNSPALAGATNGATYRYSAESADLSQWEVGYGIYTTGTGILTRATVLYNSSGTGTGSGQSGAGTKINFSTVPQVVMSCLLAEDLFAPASFTNSLGADVLLNSTTVYSAGPVVTQGNGSGTWFASGGVVFNTASGGADQVVAKLWDGTTVMDSRRGNCTATGSASSLSLSGIITNPAGNIRIDVLNITGTTGKILFNNTGNSKDSTVSVYRIG